MKSCCLAYIPQSVCEEDSFLGGSFTRISLYLKEVSVISHTLLATRTLQQLHSCQDMLGSQLQNAVIELLNSFISTDFTEVDKMRENYETASQGIHVYGIY